MRLVKQVRLEGSFGEVTLRDHCPNEYTLVTVDCRNPPSYEYTRRLDPEVEFCYFGTVWSAAYRRRGLSCVRE